MLLTFEQLADYRGRAVLADGSFDPCHDGHVAYLQQAATGVTHLMPLIVSIASADQIREKGREPLLSGESRAAVVAALSVVGAVHLKDRPTEDVLEQLRPIAYVKGPDWRGDLPAAQIERCTRLNIPIVFTDTILGSSSQALDHWRQHSDRLALERLEQLVQTQRPAEDSWEPVTDYSLESRRTIEGPHPQLIRDVFHPQQVIDAGCGPGHLLQMLSDLGINAGGFDRNPQCRRHDDVYVWTDDLTDLRIHSSPADLVICREVLEHLTIRQIRDAVDNLVALSSRFIYLTTRFAQQPTSLLSVDTADTLDPTHITMLNQNFLRTLFVLRGCRRRADMESLMDWQHKGRVLVYEVP